MGPLPKARVTVYGDSLVSQSAPYLQGVGSALGLSVTVRAFYGTAPCDFVPALREDLAARSAEIIVWAFSGNSIGTCMVDAQKKPLTGQAILDKYRADTETAAKAAEAAGELFVLVSPPAARSVGDWTGFDTMYRSLAAADARIAYVDGGVEIAPNGHFLQTESCLPFESQLAWSRSMCEATGEIVVRAADGVHFCPVAKHLTCPTYSSGSMRYALVLLAAARLDVDYHAELKPQSPARVLTRVARAP